jgi:hypothetical protein
MKRLPIPCVILPLFFLSFLARAGMAQIMLTDNGSSFYRIVLPSNPSSFENKAASELQSHLEEISGARLPIVTDKEPFSEFEIIIGNNSHLKLTGRRINFEKLSADGYLLQTKGTYLIIAGGKEKGCLYGVYSLLEMIGCRYYAPGVQYIPKVKTVKLQYIKKEEVPFFDFREMLFPVAQDSAYLLWHKLDRHQQGEWGMWVHTFSKLVPADKYFSTHPEYFSMVNGNRIPDGQLCLSNPDVLDLVINTLSEKIKSNPDAKYWSVSQNDNFLACSCPDCMKLDEAYGGPSGTMIHFVNAVAEHFPEKVISTLAYQYTRQSPKHIRPLDNVNIMLCTIECNRSRPIAEDPSGESFVEDLQGWSKLTENIILWDYVVQFRNYISPFPNFGVLQPNLQLFAGYGCRMMFQQGSGSSWSDFSDLKSYLIAKLLWDPKLDQQEIISDFMYGYYGNAAPYLIEYFDMLHEELARSGKNLWIYGYPFDAVSSYLSASLVQEYQLLFDRAEKAVNDRPEILARVKKARLPLDFAFLDISLHQFDETLSYFTSAHGEFVLKPDMVAKLDEFVENCKNADISRIQEHGTTPDEYRENVKSFFSKSLEPSQARGKSVALLQEASPKYNAGNEKALTDGLRGTDDYNFNWLGFDGNDMEAVIDLGVKAPVTRISATFLQSNYSWIFLPLEVHYYGSEDGVEYNLLGKIANAVPNTQPGSFSIPFVLDILPCSFRFLKVQALSMKTCPSWHIGAGLKCWIFVDEVVVQ